MRPNDKGCFIFVVGRPGAGKSEFFRRLSKRLMDKAWARQVYRVDDYSALWEVFRDEEARGEWRRCEKMPGGGYRVLDESLWDEVLRRAADEALSRKAPGTVVFLEFARPAYLRALENFPAEMFRKALIVYVDCSWTTCMKRNQSRRADAPAAVDEHFVSLEEMQTTYGSDDRDQLLRRAPCPSIRVDNEPEGPDNLWNHVDRVLAALKG